MAANQPRKAVKSLKLTSKRIPSVKRLKPVLPLHKSVTEN
jgi:hypothetical protein